MSDIAISVENLSKSYMVGHNSAHAERYASLRDVMARNARNIARKTRDMLSGRAIVQGDEVEEFKALNDVSFDVRSGEVLGIIGRNGAGKSTLLKILSRITEPTSGRIKITGRVASLLEVGTGFHPELTGRENIYLNGAILGMSRAEIRRKFDEIVDFAEVEKFLDTPVKRYSSGMYVRLAFAVAAHLEPEILIVDEVLAVGDAEFQKKCLGKMQDVAGHGRTVLFVSHQLGMVAKLCTRAIVLRQGQLLFGGTSADAIEAYVAQATNGTGALRTGDPRLLNLAAAITGFEALDVRGAACSEFTWHDSIRAKIRLTIRQLSSGMLLGVAIDNRHGNRVTTWVTRVADHLCIGHDWVCLELDIPGGIIAPGGYTFTVALFEPGSTVHHVIEGEWPFVIVDSGSEMAAFSNVDYGVTIIPGRWSISKGANSTVGKTEVTT